MEKGPEIRIIGKASEEKKEQAKEELIQGFFNHYESLSLRDKIILKMFERQKSEKEIALINFANKETNQLMEEAGVKPYDIPVENYHIFSLGLFKKIGGGMAFITRQGVLLFNGQYFRNNPVVFGSVVLEEMLHLKAHLSIKVDEEGKVKKWKKGSVEIPESYRAGVKIMCRSLERDISHRRNYKHFTGLNEAIVAETRKKLLGKLLDLPEFSKEKERFKSEKAKELRKKIGRKKGIPEDDIIWIDKKGKDYDIIHYFQQRNVLNYMCIEIQKQFSDQYKSVDDVFKEFQKAHFTGRLLSIARLIEKTFGEGSFRLLGNMNTDDQSGALHLESLRKARERQLRKNTYKNCKENCQKKN